ncbi:PREDICTED: 60S ribosomal protein L28-like [Elephantulus edwardii]|uniref:60S ribosomal protein L28-like n=1 Tax=Elephantulus edwardii TaxID=28737 RepID=UPI0003F06FC0|nr:PREDICTED: 60S ribosomal protein L28-like [Elephantulus edwardii]
MVLRNCSNFLIKRNKPTYSTESNDLKALNSFHYNGLIYCKTLGMEPGPNKKELSNIRNMIRKNKYHLDLRMAAIHRAAPSCAARRILDGEEEVYRSTRSP